MKTPNQKLPRVPPRPSAAEVKATVAAIEAGLKTLRGLASALEVAERWAAESARVTRKPDRK